MDAKLTDEPARLRAVDRLQALDTPRESAFDRLTMLVRTVLDVPISAVSLVDQDRQWFKSNDGMAGTETPRDAAFCAHTILSREPMVIPDAALDVRFSRNPLVIAAPGIRSYAGVPLASADGYNLGALCAIDTRTRAFSDAQIALLNDIGALVVDQLELRLIAQRDHLTGILTRRAFVDGAEAQIGRKIRAGDPCCLIVFDIDHFKAINDRFGHGVGDDVLKCVASTCAAQLRSTDLFGRIGGEEFAVCLPDTDLSAALALAERLCAAVARQMVLPPLLPRVTASFGVSALLDAETYAEWCARADRAMYVAKCAGRNRCRVDEAVQAHVLAA